MTSCCGRRNSHSGTTVLPTFFIYICITIIYYYNVNWPDECYSNIYLLSVTNNGSKMNLHDLLNLHVVEREGLYSPFKLSRRVCEGACPVRDVRVATLPLQSKVASSEQTADHTGGTEIGVHWGARKKW